ncbi:hypothetical protein E2C00_27525 [Streptomyces sp. WAC05374]|uniref:hypothetical protein n=1 Tax=Streptomyces sp. WAC05374 TaxID=2487420 RepID=UPI000F886DCC|nr:hypothetical protein [Streptomyces sp. WAC05374]RST18551.1 hypothetical protein EF905_04910 [Streptomyces sp. WAC05374]TDF43269.1 hypothetical protein E2B92_20380 [Streptomyces sp. WAC05374]TDF51055.1 hypothetical protein E2C00_27525 [Streptomyces sp. WAC05374]TDF52202.1 hypothetical protein E2C02_21640 [Streptomyces sp. WAC05374]
MQTEILVALIGVAGVVGATAGAVVGAWLQAKGGHAQAAAARAAADTAAGAAWHQAMRDMRWSVLSAYLRAASEAQEADEAVQRSGAPEALEAAKTAFHAYRLSHAEAELVAPDDVMPALERLDAELQGMHADATRRALPMQAYRMLEDLLTSHTAAAGLAIQRLEEVKQSSVETVQDRIAAARDALRAVPGLSPGCVVALSILGVFPEDLKAVLNYREAAERRSGRFTSARKGLIAAVRVALGTSV